MLSFVSRALYVDAASGGSGSSSPSTAMLRSARDGEDRESERDFAAFAGQAQGEVTGHASHPSPALPLPSLAFPALPCPSLHCPSRPVPSHPIPSRCPMCALMTRSTRPRCALRFGASQSGGRRGDTTIATRLGASQPSLPYRSYSRAGERAGHSGGCCGVPASTIARVARLQSVGMSELAQQMEQLEASGVDVIHLQPCE